MVISSLDEITERPMSAGSNSADSRSLALHRESFKSCYRNSKTK